MSGAPDADRPANPAVSAAAVRYLPWLAYDVLRRRVGTFLVLATAMSYVILLPFAAQFGPGWAEGAEGAARVRLLLTKAFELVAPLGAVLFGNELVSDERSSGAVRFLFARRLSPVAYYLARWCAAGLALLGTVGVVTLLLSLALPEVRPLTVLLMTASAWVLYGGALFLSSTLLRSDWIGLVLLVGPTLALKGHFAKSASATPVIADLMPAWDVATCTARALDDGARFSGSCVAALGWGAGCLAAGLLVIRRRALAD